MAFVSCFNRLTETECPSYSKYKICLYDINQRKFIVQVHQTMLDSDDGKESDEQSQHDDIEGNGYCSGIREIYLVHYNGFVFGANFAKMIIIREREAKEEEKESESSSDPSSDDEKEDQPMQRESGMSKDSSVGFNDLRIMSLGG